MVRVSYDQKPYRRMMMTTWGANCFPSPSEMTQAGRKILAEDPDSPGSLGIAISEAIEDAVTGKDSRYSLGSVLNHVLLHQTIIGLEAKKQIEKIGKYPDVVIGCAGGGSNFAGISLPFVRDKIHGKKITHHRRRAGILPDPDAGPLRLRLRRPGHDNPAAGHVHPRPRLRARAHPRGRAALPRHGARS